MYSIDQIVLAVVILTLLLLVGRIILQRSRLLQSVYLPASIVAGAIAIILGHEVLGGLANLYFGTEDHFLAFGIFPETSVAIWGSLPGQLISVVFATLFLGTHIPNIKEIWMRAGPQVVFGQSVAWGQYVVGITLALLILNPVFGLPYAAGALIEISFEGGHGTAAGLMGTFQEFNFEQGYDMALALATIGILSGVITGTILVNWAVRAKKIEPPDSDVASIIPTTSGKPAIKGTKAYEDTSMDPLTLHLGVVALAMAIGWLILQGLILLEDRTTVTWGAPRLMTHIPLFPLAMIGGVIIQVILMRAGRESLIDRKLIEHIGGTALDITIVAALAALSVRAIGANLAPILILGVAGITWNIFAFFVIAPRVIPTYWVNRAVGDIGQSMGVTVTGILLMRMSDPHNKSGALQSFGYKQLLFEPIVGGGLFTAAAIPLIKEFGPIPILILTAGLFSAFLIFGLKVFGPASKANFEKRW